MIRWEAHVAIMGEMKNACRILVGKPERKRPVWIQRQAYVEG
jgi:hypothetical protein